MTCLRVFLPLALAVVASAAETNPPAIFLRQNWSIQQSADVRENGEALSSTGYKTRNWYRATVPSTVFGALVQSHVYPDPYFGMNLRSVSGVSYPISTNFSNVEMPSSAGRHSA